MTEPAPAFHLAFPVHDLEAARGFYAGLLQCQTGRESSRWIDFDFFGHQITAHLSDAVESAPTNAVDGEAVPVRHFGIILEMDRWRQLSERLRQAGVQFVIEPQIRFEGHPGEQATFFISDPSGNALEFKAFADPTRIFEKEHRPK